MDESTPVGQQIAYWRKRRGLTQEVLAGRVGRSIPWLSRIERGERALDRIADLLVLARVLKVEPGDIVEGISLPPNKGAPLDPPQGLPAIRRAVLTEQTAEPPLVAKLRADVDKADGLIARGFFEALAVHLPDLVVGARSAVAEGMPGAWSYLARAYRAASSLARNVGERQLACIAADRAITAARRSGDTCSWPHPSACSHLR